MIGGARLSGTVGCDPALFVSDDCAWIDVPVDTAKQKLNPDFNILYEMVRFLAAVPAAEQLFNKVQQGRFSCCGILGQCHKMSKMEADVKIRQQQAPAPCLQERNPPRYDRHCNDSIEEPPKAAQTLNKMGHILVPSSIVRPSRPAQRCFNCGSYSHGLKVCPEPARYPHSLPGNSRTARQIAISLLRSGMFRSLRVLQHEATISPAVASSASYAKCGWIRKRELPACLWPAHPCGCCVCCSAPSEFTLHLIVCLQHVL